MSDTISNRLRVTALTIAFAAHIGASAGLAVSHAAPSNPPSPGNNNNRPPANSVTGSNANNSTSTSTGGGSHYSPTTAPSLPNSPGPSVTANTVVIRTAPPSAPPPTLPPPVIYTPAPSRQPTQPVDVPIPPPAPLPDLPPVPSVTPAPVQPLNVNKAPQSRTDNVMLTNSVDAGTSAEIIILVLLAIGVWYYSHRVIVQLTSRRPRSA